MSSTTPGFAIRRNNSCLAGYETDCGKKLASFHGCCPIGYECPSQYNIACCPSGQNCTAALLADSKPLCSNASWDLFDNRGYFCCEHGLAGFNSGGSDGCASPGYRYKGGEEVLPLIASGEEASSTASSTGSAVPSSTPSPSSSGGPSNTPDSSSSDGSSTPVGAITGGVVGGIVAIALLLFLFWFLRRRIRLNSAIAPHVGQENLEHVTDSSSYKQQLGVQELGTQQMVHEADNDPPKQIWASSRVGPPLELAGREASS